MDSNTALMNILGALGAIHATIEAQEALRERDTKALMATMILVQDKAPLDEAKVQRTTSIVDAIYGSFSVEQE